MQSCGMDKKQLLNSVTLFSVLIAIFLISHAYAECPHASLLNPYLKHAHVKTFENTYIANIGVNTYDSIDFLKPHEKISGTYYLSNQDSEGSPKINRTAGYDPKLFQVKPSIKQLRDNENVQITWLGHASFLIQFGRHRNILTDPVFHDLPFAWMLDVLKRVSPPVLNEKNLDFVSHIVISHAEYDHFDWETLDNFKEDLSYLVPLRLEEDFDCDYQNVTGMDWYTNKIDQDIRFSFVPAQHRAIRSPFNKNETLWGGWIFEAEGKRIYFAGDTAYSVIFDQIHSFYGDFDVCLMPIIAYKPYAYRRGHITPEDSLKAAAILKCKTFIPWGYGSFILGHEHVLEPLRRLEKAYVDMKPSFTDPMAIKVLKMGETFVVKERSQNNEP